MDGVGLMILFKVSVKDALSRYSDDNRFWMITIPNFFELKLV